MRAYGEMTVWYLPGIGKSDHEIVFAEIDTLPCRISKPKRKISLHQA